MPTLDDYLSIITSLYRDQPKFIALCSARLEPYADLQTVLEALRLAFDLDEAVGVQLDAVGVRVGRSRFLETPLEGVYFSWGEDGVGWNEGTWLGPYDPETGLTGLPDDAYRTLLRAKIAANSWDGTVPSAYEIWEALFAAVGMFVVIQDNQDMTMTIGVTGTYPDAVTKALLAGGYIPLKPAGVAIDRYAIAPQGGPLFVWGADSEQLSGWGAGSWPENITP
jgi:hypothetical protein